MIQNDIINEVKSRLVDVYDPEKIYLFGSYAWGSPRDDSDLDLMIIIKKSDTVLYKRPIAGHKVLFGLNIPKDIIVYTEEEFKQRYSEQNSFCYKIFHEGKILYANFEFVEHKID